MVCSGRQESKSRGHEGEDRRRWEEGGRFGVGEQKKCRKAKGGRREVDEALAPAKPETATFNPDGTTAGRRRTSQDFSSSDHVRSLVDLGNIHATIASTSLIQQDVNPPSGAAAWTVRVSVLTIT